MEPSALHVLIIEDEPGHIVAIQRAFALARAQDTVRTVGSLKESRDAIAAAAPDVIVTDMHLPDGRAFELLNSPDIAGNFPVIVMTGYGNEMVAVEAIKSGAIEYVVKSPEALNDMPRTVERVMREWGQAQEVKKARDALAFSQAELSAVFDGIPVMLCIIDSDRCVLNANRAFNDFVSGVALDIPQERPCGIMGCIRALDDPAGCGFGSMCGECTLRRAMDETLRIGNPHINVECEIPIRRNGVEQTLVFLGSVTPMSPVDGTSRALVSLLDITARRQAESKLRESEEQLLSLFNGIDEVVYVSDPETYELIFTNDAMKTVFGTPVQGKCYEYLQHRDFPCPFCTNDRIFGPDKGSSYVWEHKNENNDRWYRCIDKAILWPDGRWVRYEMAIDVTERKLVEQKLSESEGLLARSQQVAQLGSWQYDAVVQRMIWSDELYCILGLSPDKHAADHHAFFEVVHPDDMPAAWDFYREFFSGEKDSLEYVYRIIRKDTSEIRHMHVRCIIEHDTDGTVARFIGMVQDITASKQAEEKAAEYVRELEQWYRVTLNREDRVLELKTEVNKLLERQGEERKYGENE